VKVAESGLILKPSTRLAVCPRLDTLIVPSGRGLREPRTNQIIATWIKGRAATTRRIASVCTGIYGLAPTGLLDGIAVTTHCRFVNFSRVHSGSGNAYDTDSRQSAER
jgi:transcriptional regulator GlxA family with amidase domain